MAKSDVEIVAKLKETFPGMSKSVFSMGKKPDYYGVELTELAQLLAGLKSRKTDKRRKPYRITFRLTKSEFEQFELARGADTRQDFCAEIVRQALQIGGAQ